MPKINVYLPDELAEAVKDAGLPVSAICQRALEQAVRRVTAIRETVVRGMDIDESSGRLAHFTPRSRQALRLGVERARAEGAGAVGTEHLLAGILAEGQNLALHVLRAIDIEPAELERDLGGPPPTTSSGGEEPIRFDGTAANALELAVTDAQAFGHNYIGCEHLLLGLVAEPDGKAGQLLRARGAEPRLTRRAVASALAGYVHLKAQGQTQAQDPAQLVAAAVRRELHPLVERLERLERHAGIADAADTPEDGR
ncbi:ATP-dependent Clp protease ATP-binding subunit [Microbispora sp. RL4-1S]|uniref:ATP-dependent Clp protease ATP-binding subunit n=1 Tax=Microbispora oryzae TaxID=2806554 RepID=A0A940WK53_9ACTN|nr:ATP-dependent Clp protease ATP-binding subunit [Microbispora oryzae]MBP2707179.1 ATP-dependent Clp protease ATP-binding subunit [Microbispora oryzae]